MGIHHFPHPHLIPGDCYQSTKMYRLNFGFLTHELCYIELGYTVFKWKFYVRI